MSKKHPRVQCTANDRKGVRCGRNCGYPPSIPPLCSVHLKMAAGQTGVGNKPANVTPDEVLQRLLKDPDASIRLRSAENILKREERQTEKCQACENQKASDAFRLELLRAITPDERAQFQKLLLELRSLKAVVRARIQAPGYVRPAPIEDETEPDDSTLEYRAVTNQLDMITPVAKPTRKPRSQSAITKPDDPYHRDSILHQVEYTDSAGFLCIGDDRGLSDDILATAQRTAASVTLRSSIIDQQCKLVDEHNAATI